MIEVFTQRTGIANHFGDVVSPVRVNIAMVIWTSGGAGISSAGKMPVPTIFWTAREDPAMPRTMAKNVM